MLGVCGKISERFWSFSDLNLNRLLQTKVKINLYQFNIETAKYLPEECDWTSVHVDDWKIIPEFQEVETWFTNIMLATYGGKSIDYAEKTIVSENLLLTWKPERSCDLIGTEVT